MIYYTIEQIWEAKEADLCVICDSPSCNKDNLFCDDHYSLWMQSGPSLEQFVNSQTEVLADSYWIFNE